MDYYRFKIYNQNLDEFEDIEVISIPLDQIDNYIENGTISTLSSITAIELARKNMASVP